MNNKMEITKKVSRFSHTLAKRIKALNIEAMSISELESYLETSINERTSQFQEVCDICNEPYEKAVYFWNGGAFENYLGGTICEECLEKGVALLRSDK